MPHRYGTVELVEMIDSAARTVAEQFPGSSLLVGDLSRETGGRLTSHRSHRSGRDADIGFYVMAEDGAQAQVTRFVRFGERGLPLDGNGADLRFDVPRNWAFLRAMIEYPNAQIQYLFVYQPLADLMLEYAGTQDVPEAIMERARDILSGEHRSGRHDNHFHVRIHCPAGDDGCVNNESRRRRGRARHGRARARG
jgi:penicillin-insensitive murein endopeptidase